MLKIVIIYLLKINCFRILIEQVFYYFISLFSDYDVTILLDFKMFARYGTVVGWMSLILDVPSSYFAHACRGWSTIGQNRNILNGSK